MRNWFRRFTRAEDSHSNTNLEVVTMGFIIFGVVLNAFTFIHNVIYNWNMF